MRRHLASGHYAFFYAAQLRSSFHGRSSGLEGRPEWVLDAVHAVVDHLVDAADRADPQLDLGDLYTESGQALQGSFSSVSKPNLAS